MKLKLSIVFVLLSIQIIAQDTTGTIKKYGARPQFFDKKKLFFGGNFGLQFGTSTFIDVSPLAGYRITDKISVGVGITYQYYSYKSNTYKLETNIYGGRVFGRYFFRKNLFAHVEYEELNLQAFDSYPIRRVEVGSFLVGGGFIQRFGLNSGFTATILYNLTPSYYTPYQNPILRIGVIVGF